MTICPLSSVFTLIRRDFGFYVIIIHFKKSIPGAVLL